MSLSPQPITSVACLNLDQIGRLLWAQSYAMAVQLNTSVQWKPYKDSKLLNLAYVLMPWKGGPGWVEVEQNQRRIQEKSKEYFDRGLDVLMKKFCEGPASVMRYLSDAEKIRDHALQGVAEAFRSASDINREVLGETSQGIKRLAVIKATSSIALAGMSGGLALAGGSVGLVATAGSVNLGFSLTKAVVKNWGELATVGALAIELSKDAASDLMQKGGEKMIGTGVAHVWTAAPKWAEAQKRIMTLSGDLARKTSTQKKAKIGRKLIASQQKLAGAEAQAAKGIQMVRIGKNVVRYVPVVFAGLDILDAIVEYQEDTSL
jgi:hypothetical protein